MQKLRHAIRNNSRPAKRAPPSRIPDIEVYSHRPMGTNSRPFDIVPTKRTDRGNERHRRHIIQDAISVRAVSIKILAIRHDIRKRSENFPQAWFMVRRCSYGEERASAGAAKKPDGGRKGRRVTLWTVNSPFRIVDLPISSTAGRRILRHLGSREKCPRYTRFFYYLQRCTTNAR